MTRGADPHAGLPFFWRIENLKHIFPIGDYIAGPASGQSRGVWCKFPTLDNLSNPTSSQIA